MTAFYVVVFQCEYVRRITEKRMKEKTKKKEAEENERMKNVQLNCRVQHPNAAGECSIPLFFFYYYKHFFVFASFFFFVFYFFIRETKRKYGGIAPGGDRENVKEKLRPADLFPWEGNVITAVTKERECLDFFLSFFVVVILFTVFPCL